MVVRGAKCFFLGWAVGGSGFTIMTLQWKGLNLNRRGPQVLKIAIFEGSGFLGPKN